MDTAVEYGQVMDDVPNVATALSWQARRQPNVTAIHYPQKATFGRTTWSSFTFQELDELCNAYAQGLKECGIGQNMRAALTLTPGPDLYALFFALVRNGAVPVLLDPGLDTEALLQCLGESSPQAFLYTAKTAAPRKVLGWVKEHCEFRVTAGPKLGPHSVNLKQLAEMGSADANGATETVEPDKTALIRFTAGSSSAPRGVVYRHRHLNAQAELLRSAFGIEPGEISLPGCLPFALLEPALGLTTVVPDMDPAHPGNTDPKKLVAAIDRFEVSNIFASPALLDTLSRHCTDRGTRLESVTRVIAAGAALPLSLVQRIQRSLYRDAAIHLPYGTAECLPISSVSATQFDEKMIDRVESGDGLCLGHPIDPNEVRIIKISDMAYNDVSETTEIPFGMPGEVVVTGPACTDSYLHKSSDGALAMFGDGDGRNWHRTGDVGVLDGLGRLWYCGRVAERVDTGEETLFAEQCEAIFNQHPDLRRSAVVGVGPKGRQIPVLCIEIRGKLSPVDNERVHFDLLQLAQAHSITRSIRTVMFHPGFPVRHGDRFRIARGELATWAAGKMQG